MTLVEKINEGIKDAMRSKDQVRLDTLRMLKSKILAVDARCNLSDIEVVKLFKTYSGNLQEALEQAQAVNRGDMSEKLKQELNIVQEFLPIALSHEETEKLVKQAIAESHAESKKDLGSVMKILKQHPSIDAKLAKELADKFLSN